MTHARMFWSLAFLAMMAPPALAVIPASTEITGAPEIGFSIGYSNISLGSDSAISDEGALRFVPSASFSPIRPLPQLRLGADVGTTLVLDNSTRTIVSGSNGLIVVG